MRSKFIVSFLPFSSGEKFSFFPVCGVTDASPPLSLCAVVRGSRSVRFFVFFFLPFFYYFSFSPRFRLFIFIFLNVTQRALIQVACSCLKTCNDLSSYSRNKGREKRKRQSLSVGRGTDGAINKPTLFKRGIMNFNLCLFSFLFSSFILVYLRVLRCE